MDLEYEKEERGVCLIERKSFITCIMNLRMGYLGRDVQKAFRYMSLQLRIEARAKGW